MTEQWPETKFARCITTRDILAFLYFCGISEKFNIDTKIIGKIRIKNADMRFPCKHLLIASIGTATVEAG